MVVGRIRQVKRIATVVAAALVAGLTVVGAAGDATAAGRRTLIIAAGEVSGYYFPVAGAICRVINKDHPHGFGCAVMPSSGSAANVAALKSGEADLALVQSKVAQLAFVGEDPFKEQGAMADLRGLMSLHGEVAVVLARPGSGIEQMGDLKGKRVNLGRPGSFQRGMADTVLDAGGLSQGDMAPVVELDLAEQGGELCQGAIDAAVFTGVHPMPEVQAAIEECGATLVAVKGKSMDAFLRKAPYLSRLAVKGGTYEGQKEDVGGIGVKAVLATTTRMTPDEVYDVMKVVYANFVSFTRLHPVLHGLTKAAAHEGIPIRLHDGAEKLYAEVGLK
jgi:TRAP transporter TAXI family solute receptor